MYFSRVERERNLRREFSWQQWRQAVIGPAELCHKVSEGLRESAKERKWRIVVHQCELVAKIIESSLSLGIDFIIFVFDWRTTQSLSEVETNISLIDEHYIISGAVCLVNCRGISNIMGLTSHKSAKIREKYNIRFLSANVFKPQICVQLSNRILNLVEAILGITSGIPTTGLLI
ncbi:uncharacterized protein LOC126918493 isoform X1 [Bombus affinis]|uniref:uncharacterized protein LOC126918493 isoform X1 n=1 Tax=Bombus affinis TaxID=309941 RepID=UPI0021B7A12B|nr:uncharacterized protein LOC126918493 isoform X1 [Bombus affinis]